MCVERKGKMLDRKEKKKKADRSRSAFGCINECGRERVCRSARFQKCFSWAVLGCCASFECQRGLERERETDVCISVSTIHTKI